MTSCTLSANTFALTDGGIGNYTATYTVGNGAGPGTVRVVVYSTTDSMVSTLTVNVRNFTIDTTTTNLTDQILTLCANSCYAANTVFSTAPYYTLSAPRNATLVYTEERAHPRPVIYADVVPDASITPTQYTLEATLNGTTVRFSNGDTKLYFSGSSAPVRLTGQMDTSSTSYSTNIYPLVVTVTAIYSGGATVQRSYSRPLVIVNESHSPLGRGWTIAGVQHVYVSGTSYAITDGTGSAVSFSGLGVKAADYTTLTYNPGGAYYTRTYPDSTRVYFTAAGQDTLHIDRLGFRTRYTYSGGRLQSIYDPEWSLRGNTGMYLTVSYGTYGISAISESGITGGRTTSFSVASDSTLRSATDPDGVATNYTYDGSGRLARVINRRGDTTTYVYDATSWKLKEFDLPRISANIGSGNTTNVIPKIKYVPWQTLGVPTTHTSTSAPSTPVTTSNVKATVTDPIGRVTTVVPDRWGQPLSITDPASRITTISRLGRLPVKIVHPNGGVDTMAYTTGTPLISYTKLAGDSALNYRYGVFGQVDSIWGSATVPQRRFLQTTTGRVDSIRYAGANTTIVRYYYDGSQRDTLYKDASPHFFRTHYDPVFGNVDTTVNPGGLKTTHQFDAFGRDSITHASGLPYPTNILHDVLNRVTKTWRAGATNDTTSIAYDNLYPVRIRTAGGQVYKNTVNALGWVTAQYRPYDTTTLALSYRYDTAGRPTSFTNRRGQRVDITYDALNQITSRSGTNIPTDTYTYNTTGRIVTGARDTLSKDTIYTGLSGQTDSIARRFGGHQFRILYGYNDYNSAGAVRDSVRITNDWSINFEKLVETIVPDSMPKDSMRVSGGNGGTTVLKSNKDDLPTAVTWPSGATPGNIAIASTASHWLDSAVYTPGTTADSLTRQFAYDSLGRITFEVRPTTYGGPSTPWVRRFFTYDGLGRLTQILREKGGACDAYTDSILGSGEHCISLLTNPFFELSLDTAWYDAASNRIVNSDSVTYDKGVRLTAWLGTTYTYDADGNLQTRMHNGVTDTFFWNALNQLDSIKSGTLRVRYEYNAFGQLVRRSRNGVVDRYFLWDQSNLLAEISGTGKRIAQYVYHGTDQPFALITDSASTSLVRYFGQDGTGNVIGVMRHAALSQFTLFKPWGQIEQQPINTLSDTNRLAWKGLVYEGDSTRLYYMRNRWYDPQVGRFISEDPLGVRGGANLYTFADNDPIDGTDSWGLHNENEGEFPPWDNPPSPAHCGSFKSTVISAITFGLVKPKKVCPKFTPPSPTRMGPWIDFVGAIRTSSRGAPNTGEWVEPSVYRVFGPDGRAVVDYNWGHNHGAGDPHAHDWDWTKTPPRQGGGGRPIEPGELSAPIEGIVSPGIQSLWEMMSGLPIMIFVRPQDMCTFAPCNSHGRV